MDQTQGGLQPGCTGGWSPGLTYACSQPSIGSLDRSIEQGIISRTMTRSNQSRVAYVTPVTAGRYCGLTLAAGRGMSSRGDEPPSIAEGHSRKRDPPRRGCCGLCYEPLVLNDGHHRDWVRARRPAQRRSRRSSPPRPWPGLARHHGWVANIMTTEPLRFATFPRDRRTGAGHVQPAARAGDPADGGLVAEGAMHVD
jgi:hypothetical protein